jgi:hypothetical protein
MHAVLIVACPVNGLSCTAGHRAARAR